MNYFLISDTKFRKTFDIINILSHEFPKIPILLGSKSLSLLEKLWHFFIYGNRKIVLLRTYDKVLMEQDLNRLNKEYKNSNLIYIPIEEETTDHFCSYLEKNRQTIFKYLLPESKLYKTFRNKELLNEYCLNNNISAPKKYDIPNIPSDAYPIIIKPQIGSGSNGIIILEKEEDYTNEIKKTITTKPFLAQELIPHGKDVQGAFYLCKEGEVLRAFTHNRIRTMPESGGVSVFSKIGHNNKLIEEGTKLLEKAKWNGIIMLEFLYDPTTNTYKIIEANPRLWGSIMLSEYSGANILKNYVNLCIGNPIEQPTEINNSCYIRWPIIDFIGYIKKHCKIKNFWCKKNTCFINWTYARKDRAILFLLVSTFNISNLKKLLRKK